MNVTIYEGWPNESEAPWIMDRWKPGTWQRAEESVRLPRTWAVRGEITLSYPEWQEVQGLS